MSKSYRFVLLFFFLFATTLLAQDPLGNVSLQIGDQPGQKFPVKRAVLYNGVSLNYDTTLQVHNGNKTRYLWYPQLSKGTHRVLHMILSSSTIAQNETQLSYDLYLDLGDSLYSPMPFDAEKHRVYLYQGGRLIDKPISGSNVNGEFMLDENENAGNVSGNFDLSFSFDVDGSGEPQAIAIKGDLTGNLMEGAEGSLSRATVRKNNLQRNVYLAVISALFLIAFSLR